MFDNKLKMRENKGKLYAGLIVSGVGIRASEPIKNNPRLAFAKVMEKIVSAAEFFPLREVVGPESFTKAAELFVAMKKGDAPMKRFVSKEVDQIIHNARVKGDPTAQDIDYALARLSRDYQDREFNLNGDFKFDALGFSPVNLRNNLDSMAKYNKPMADAKKLYGELVSGDSARAERAKQIIRVIKQRTDGPENNNTIVGRAVLMGVSQYIKAGNAKALREELFDNENITVGLSFRGLKKSVKSAAKSVRKATPRKVLKAMVKAPVRTARAMKTIVKNPKKALIATAVVATLGPAAIPILASKKGRQALGLTSKAKKGDKKAITQIRALNEKAKAGDIEAKQSMEAVRTADAAIEKLPPAAVQEMQQSAPEELYEPEQMAPEQEQEQEQEQSLEPDEGQDESFAEEMTDEALEGFSFKSLAKKATGALKPLAKSLTPLAAAAANSFAPGSGALISKAMPSLIDAVPGKERPELAQIAKGMGLIKAADEMNPQALEKIATIKKLSAQGVPQATVALNALKIAKGAQQIAETVVTAQAEAKESFPKDSTQPIPVKIVAWGK